MWILVGLGTVGGLISAFRSPATGIPSTAPGQPDAPAPVTGFAELAVRQWLGNDDLSGEASIGDPDRGAAVAPVVTATDAVATRAVTDHYWAVTVAVEVGQPGGGSALWFVEIGVFETPEGLLASGAPAVVPSPVRGDPAVPVGQALSVPGPDDPIAATSQAFLEALLTGQGDVSRYLAPGAQLAPVGSVFESVRVQRTAEVETSAQRLVVRVEALATTVGMEVHLGYELTLEQRAGRWEVRRLSGAPTLRRVPTPSASTTSTTTPETVPTTTSVAPASPGA